MAEMNPDWTWIYLYVKEHMNILKESFVTFSLLCLSNSPLTTKMWDQIDVLNLWWSRSFYIIKQKNRYWVYLYSKITFYSHHTGLPLHIYYHFFCCGPWYKWLAQMWIHRVFQISPQDCSPLKTTTHTQINRY